MMGFVFDLNKLELDFDERIFNIVAPPYKVYPR